MTNQITFTNGTEEIKAELINGEWNAPAGCAFPSKEMMVDFLQAEGFKAVEDEDHMTEQQRKVFKWKSNYQGQRLF